MMNLERRIRKLELQVFGRDDGRVTWEEFLLLLWARGRRAPQRSGRVPGWSKILGPHPTHTGKEGAP